jgi:lysozyme family protein
MASFDKYSGKLLSFEGGYVNNPVDRGGPTKFGVILSTWKEYGYDLDKDGDIDIDDLKQITTADARNIAKKIFWDYFKADQIRNQSIAELIVDWGYNSGRTTVARRIQRILGLPLDGLVGPQTLKAINQVNQEKFFNAIKKDRKDFIDYLVRIDPEQKIFYQGWMNRINKFFFLEELLSGQ